MTGLLNRLPATAAALTVVAITAAFFIVRDNLPFCDENAHYLQALRFANKQKALDILGGDPAIRLIDPRVDAMAVHGDGTVAFVSKVGPEALSEKSEIRPVESNSIFYYAVDGLRPVPRERYSETIGAHPTIRTVSTDFFTLPSLTTLPGYNAAVGLTGRLFGVESIPSLRTISFILSLLTLVSFALLCHKLGAESASVKWMQFAWLPVIFPFFPLFYTDVFSMGFFFLALYFVVRDKYVLSGIVISSSLIVRQTNIVWLFFLSVFIYIETFGLRAINARELKEWLWKCRTLWIGGLGFMVFAYINGGIAIGDKYMHPPAGFHLGNVYFCLFLHFFLFLPLHLSNTRKILLSAKSRPSTLTVLPLLFLLYWFTFNVDHPYNYGALTTHFLRNKILLFFTSDLSLRALFFIPVSFTVMSLMVTRLRRPSFYLLYPFTVLSLVPCWLIEQRYYMLPFSLFILFKEETSLRDELITLAYYVAGSLLLFNGIAKQTFFL